MKQIAFALLLVSGGSFAQDHLELVRTTPCLEQYRLWVFTFRHSEVFQIPDGVTPEQCEAAKLVHARIQTEQVAEKARMESEGYARSVRKKEAEEAPPVQRVAKAKPQPKKPGASIGMTMQQVINETQWGKPQSVNRTTTASSTREQWVYGGRNYLYFTNGILTSIQN